MGPIKTSLSENDLNEIKQLLKKGDVNVRVIKRAQILKFRHHRLGTEEIATLLDVDPKLISITLNNYLEFGLKITIEDAPRTGRPINIDSRDKANIIALVCSEPPKGYARWTLDLIKEESESRGMINSISRSSIQIILNEHDLKPWREKMWCVPSLDDDYIRAMEDVLKVYERPYNVDKPVICLDEKPVALLGDRFDRSSCAPGKVAKKDYQYTRNGSANVFCAVEPLQGVYINKVTKNRKKPEFAKFLNDLSRKYKDAKKIVLVMDNLNTHKKNSLIEFYGEGKADELWGRFEVHYTPKHGSWLNQAEIAIGMFSSQSLGDGRVQSFEKLKEKTKNWNAAINKKRKTIKWKFNRKDAREKFNYEMVSSG